MYLNFEQRFFLLFSWLLFIIVLLLMPLPFNTSSVGITFYDKIIHAFLFGVFAFLVFYLLEDGDNEFLVLNPQKNIRLKKNNKNFYINKNRLLKIFLSSFMSSSLLAIALEYLQNYVPGRTVSNYDSLAGIIGVLLVLIFIYGDSYVGKKT